MKTRADEESDEDEDNGYEYKDSMKTLTKKGRRKTDKKKEKLMKMSKMKKLMKTGARDDFEYIETMMKIRTTPMSTVEPLSNDHPHQRPSLLYDHISCDGQCFLFVRSLTDDHPSNVTSDRVR